MRDWKKLWLVLSLTKWWVNIRSSKKVNQLLVVIFYSDFAAMIFPAHISAIKYKNNIKSLVPSIKSHCISHVRSRCYKQPLLEANELSHLAEESFIMNKCNYLLNICVFYHIAVATIYESNKPLKATLQCVLKDVFVLLPIVTF